MWCLKEEEEALLLIRLKKTIQNINKDNKSNKETKTLSGKQSSAYLKDINQGKWHWIIKWNNSWLKKIRGKKIDHKKGKSRLILQHKK